MTLDDYQAHHGTDLPSAKNTWPTTTKVGLYGRTGGSRQSQEVEKEGQGLTEFARCSLPPFLFLLGVWYELVCFDFDACLVHPIWISPTMPSFWHLPIFPHQALSCQASLLEAESFAPGTRAGGEMCLMYPYVEVGPVTCVFFHTVPLTSDETRVNLCAFSFESPILWQFRQLNFNLFVEIPLERPRLLGQTSQHLSEGPTSGTQRWVERPAWQMRRSRGAVSRDESNSQVGLEMVPCSFGNLRWNVVNHGKPI